MTHSDAAADDAGNVLRAALLNQMLWTAGYALTSGGYVSYFGRELGAGGGQIALLLAVPETVGILGLWTRQIVLRTANRKRTWLRFSLAARAISLGIPLMAFPALRPVGMDPLWILIACLAASGGFGAIAYLALLSWMADLVPAHRWGRFFALRHIAEVVILMFLPTLAGYLLNSWKQGVDAETALLGYVVAFVIGTLLQLGSLLPIWKLPDVPLRPVVLSEETVSTGQGVSETSVPGRSSPHWTTKVQQVWRDRSLRFLCLHNWHLAVAQGMTQAVFFIWQKDVLKISLGTFFVLQNVMRVAMIPASLLAGRWSDRGHDLRGLVGGLLFVSLAMIFWLFSSPETWWLLFGAYLCWGGFAVVNISGRNLVLRNSPHRDNVAELSLYLQPAGLLAGVSGLLGGLWLDRLIKSDFELVWNQGVIGPFQLLFLVSFAGRVTAPIWLAGILTETKTGRGIPPSRG